jgi:uncharacterized protein
MPPRSSYTQGTPNWVDLQTTDPAAAKAFYGTLFGWTFDDMPMPENGVYSMAMVGDHTVAAIAPQPPEMARNGVPPLWNTYIAVDDVDATAARVAQLGGSLMMEPFDINDAGRMAWVGDATGANAGLWQAGRHIGATLVNEPNTLTWNELISDDLPTALPFWEKLVGITGQEGPPVGDQPYTMLYVGEAMAGGATAPMMPGIPNHWHVWFAVADADATAAAATAAGGSIMYGPEDIPIGRIVVITDPQGAVFSVIQMNPQS